MRTFRYNQRPAFTLIEILVVIAIIGVLAGLAIYFIPSFQTSERSARGGANLQSWISAARLRAIRDQAPRGIRLLYNPAINGDVTLKGWDRAQYLEQPDDLGAAKFYHSALNTWLSLQLRKDPVNGLKNIVFVTDSNTGKWVFDFGKNVGGRFSGKDGINFNDDDPPVQIGDYLEIDGVALPRYIVGSEQSDPKTPIWDMLVLWSPLPEAISNPIGNFRIVRQPRVVGDEIFELPSTIYVDQVTHNTYASGLNFLEQYPAGDLDIMFSPTGAVMPGKFSKPHVVLWVRSTDYPTALEGEPTLVVVYVNSGLVAAYQVNPGNPANPYDLVK